MANPTHVNLVKQGRRAIEDWRAKHVGERLDLGNADLSGLDLSRTDLSVRLEDVEVAYFGPDPDKDITFLRADLSRADLREADLSWADLGLADLRGSDLSGATLHGAEFVMANLRGANLYGARLGYANLSGADMADVNVQSAVLLETVFGDTDLSEVRGLADVVHEGPSVVDERTLRRSWPLPQKFLRGCGLSDQLIDYLPSLLNQAIEFYSCFISYSSEDQEFADRLCADLQNKGVRCWFAPEDLKIGDRFRVRIDESIRLHDKLLLILSEQSLNSQWVEQEVETALAKERKAEERGGQRTVLFPIRLDDAVMEMEGGWAALIYNSRHIGDFTRWKEHDAYQQAFERLLRDLKAGGAQP